MGESNQENPLRLHGIELISFSIQPKPAKDYSGEIFEFNINQELKTNDKKKLIIAFTTITIRESGKDPSLANLVVACGFEISAFERMLKKNTEGVYLIPHDLNMAISRISIATARGILYGQLRGSYLQSTTLPILLVE